MTESLKLTGATSGLGKHWESIDWNKVNAEVKRLQMRIAKAVREGKTNKVKALQWILSHSFFAKLLAVKRVTSSKGAKTPGVDGAIWNTPAKKMKGAISLIRRGYKALPLRRILIPKKNGKMRPLGIPTIRDRAMQALYLITLSPIAETTADPNSYGFRYFRACRDAIGQCFISLAKSYSPKWILDADIKACFDEIDHEWLLSNIIPAINGFLKPRGLMLSPEKTKIVKIDEGLDFLGQNLRKYRNKLITKPSKDNAQSFLTKVRDTIKNCHGWKTEDMIRKLNPIIRGWAHYHRYVQSAKTFSYANKIIFESLWRWIKRRHPEKSCKWIIKNYFNSPNHNWGFCCWVKDRSGKKKLLELIKPTHVKLVRYIKIRGVYHPFDPKYSEYFNKRAISRNCYPIA